MTSFGKILTIATLAVGIGVMTAPMASACGNVITQPAVIDTSLAAPVLDNTLVQPAVIGASGCSTCADTTMIEPAVVDTGCASTLVQPAVVAPACDPCAVRVRHHLIGLDTPFFGIHLF